MSTFNKRFYNIRKIEQTELNKKYTISRFGLLLFLVIAILFIYYGHQDNTTNFYLVIIK